MKFSATSAEPQRSVHSSAWPLVPLGEILTQRGPDVRVEPTESYQFAGVYSFGRGVFRGPLKKGNEFAYPVLTRLRAGEFVYPKLMAWEGAFGVVPTSCDGFFASPEFPVFEINARRADPRFIEIYFRMARAWESLSARSTGTNVRRRRLNPSDLLRHNIPLPPLSSQQEIADALQKVVARTSSLREHSATQAKDLRALLESEFQRIASESPIRPMGDVAPIVRRPVKVESEKEYPEIGVRSFGRGTFHKPSLTGADLGGKRVFKISEGDLLFMNVFAWEGAIAVASANDEGRVGSHRFITCVPDPDAMTAEFLCFYFLTSAGIEQIRKASPGSAGRNRTLSIEALMRMPVPCPSLKVQVCFNHIRAKVKELTRCTEAQLNDFEALERSIVAAAFRPKRPSDPRTYLLQFVPALLWAAGGLLSLEEISRAYALFFQPDTLLPLIEATGDAAAQRHFAELPPLEAKVFVQMLQELHRAGVIEQDAATHDLHLGKVSPPPIAAAVAEDARHLAAILNLVPREAVRTMTRKLCPHPARELFAALT